MKTKKTVIFMGYSCNNNCIFCCNSERRKRIKDESTTRIKRRILDAKKEGTAYLELIGGEPTIRKDIFSIVSFAKKLDFDVIMFATNGRMLSNCGFAKKIVEAGVNHIVFSIHGHTPQLHDALTKAPGSFKQLIKGINNLKSMGFSKIGSNTTIVKQNYRHLPEIGKFIYGLGIRNSEFIFVDPTRGGPKENFYSIVPGYEEVSPYINKLLEFGKTKKIPHWHIRYYPLCFIDGGYHDMVSEIKEKEIFKTEHLAPDFINKNVEESRGVVGRTKLDSCKDCKHYNICEGYWKEYAKKMPKKVPSFSASSGTSLLVEASLPDIIAVKNGIKPFTRISCKNPLDYQKLKEWCKKNSLFAKHSKYKLLDDEIEKRTYESRSKNLAELASKRKGTFHAYISKDKEISKKASKSDPEIALKPSEKNVRKFGLLLGYPECCVNEHVQKWQKKAPECLGKFKPPKIMPFYMNNLLNCVSNHYLSFHYPCSFECKKTLRYSKSIFSAIKEEYPEFAEEIRRRLTMPFLVWFDNKKNVYPSWDSRRGIVFSGFVKRNKIEYNKCFLIKPTHKRINSNFDINPSVFSKGNMIKISKQGFELFAGKTKVQSYKIKNQLQSVLFNFKNGK